ncbi:hypothetical protein AAFF_G00117530 [Aldrovandia affinis]|uniref:Uncharacterized protein n=1 Tax=Aldrovandia affinis TaxID=143900 RepID=A0AAD7T1P8_9TELE|nr:hypothetical protein AAFF_G00117530 [Aldrovandia affinis]
MPLWGDLFPQWSTHCRSPKVPGRSEGSGVCVLPSIPESPALQDQQGLRRSPVRTRTSPFLYSLQLRKALSPPRPSGSKSVMDSFIYEDWRVHPLGPAPRWAFEDHCPGDSEEPGKQGSLQERGQDALKHSVTRGGPSDQDHGNRARHSGRGSCLTAIRGGHSKGHGQQEGHSLTESSNKSLSIYDFYKCCKIDCWNKINNCGVFKA